MSTGKRLFEYAKTSRKTIITGLLLLVVAVAAELTGPFIAKAIIDRHIAGVVEPWYETTEQPNAVQYNGQWIIREYYADAPETKEPVGQFVQIGTQFYWAEDILPVGQRSYEEGAIVVAGNQTTTRVDASPLNGNEVLAFYAPEGPKIMGWLAFYFGLIVIAMFFQYGQNFLLKKSANRIIQKLRVDVFAHLSRLPVRFFDNLPAGKVVSRVTNDTEAIRELYVAVLSNFFTSGIYMTGIYIALFLLSPQLATYSLLLIPVLILWIIIYRKLASGYNHQIRSKISEINGDMNENIQA